MQRSEPQSIGDILRLTLQETDRAGKLDECRAVEAWYPIVGRAMAEKCGCPMVRQGVMIIPVKGASLRHELTMNRSSLIRLINAKLGKNVITEIRFVGGSNG